MQQLGPDLGSAYESTGCFATARGGGALLPVLSVPADVCVCLQVEEAVEGYQQLQIAAAAVRICQQSTRPHATCRAIALLLSRNELRS